MTLQIKKRGRPSKADIAAKAANKPKPRNDSRILSDTKERFDIMELLTAGVIGNNVRSLVVSGGPGVGKTYRIESILENSNAQFEVVRGAMSAINLYMLGYKYRKPGNVIVLDDADSIFTDEDALNILKGLCDSSAVRKVSYMKEAWQLAEEDIPKSYDFQGAMIFISNLDFQAYVDQGKNKYVAHFEALMSRSLYLDLRLHSRAELGIWVNYVAEDAKIFDRENVPVKYRKAILSFMTKHREEFRELSIRTLLKVCQLVKTNPDRWESMARILLTRN